MYVIKANGRRETLLPSLLPSVSDDRHEMLQKTFDRKLPWTDMETQYYDAVSAFLFHSLQLFDAYTKFKACFKAFAPYVSVAVCQATFNSVD